METREKATLRERVLNAFSGMTLKQRAELLEAAESIRGRRVSYALSDRPEQEVPLAHRSKNL